ncbi:hypothetical protein D3C87_85310 [compost metagenome]
MIKITTFIASLLLFVQMATAQFIFKPEYIAIAPFPYQDGNTVVLQALNPLPGMHFYHRNTEYQVGDTIYDYATYDSIICEYFQNTLISVMGPNQDFEMNLFQSPSSLNSHDGEMILHFNHKQAFFAGNFDINYPAPPGGNYGLRPESSDSIAFRFIQTIASAFTIHGNASAVGIEDAFFANPFRIGGIFFDQNMQFFSPQGLRLEVSLSDVTTNCDGTAQVTPVNAVGTITYEWDNDPSLNTNVVTGLCPGVHYVIGTDAANQHSAFRQFVITDITQNYYDPTSAALATDTVQLTYMNCELDYTAPIDSIQLDVQFQSEANNTFYYGFNLLVFQHSDTVSITSVVSTESASSVSLFDIAFYCEGLKSADFKGKRILSAKDLSTLGLAEMLKEETVSFYPNPVEDYLNFPAGQYSGEIFDLNGRKMASFDQQNKVFVSGLKEGVYLIQLNGQAKAVRFLKK